MDWHIECEDVWKIFGRNERGALKAIREQSLDKSDTKSHLGHIVGVTVGKVGNPRIRQHRQIGHVGQIVSVGVPALAAFGVGRVEVPTSRPDYG